MHNASLVYVSVSPVLRDTRLALRWIASTVAFKSRMCCFS
ncbi:Uncharacterised protein [Mycobacteroides abscessus subsp. abscessus]|nr:Uncharacterised protein [Mycobacteroides abscessus subsp. abscessus]